MSRADYVPNERIVDRAVELWVRMLRAPEYDNGDRSLTSAMAVAMVTLASVSGDDVLERFRTELKSRLMNKFTYPPYREDAEPHTEWVDRLNVDYDPDHVLAAAAVASGLKTQFPWKTTMWFHGSAVSVSAGYGGCEVNHYPMADGSWLVTTLRGNPQATQALVAFAESGQRAEFFEVQP